MTALGTHLLIELYGCDANILNSVADIERTLIDAANAANATIVKPVFHKFSPHGVSGVLVIAESHFALHTWPEHAYCALDIFTCGDTIDTDKAMERIKTAFHAENVEVNKIERGINRSDDAWGMCTSVDLHDCNPDTIRDAEKIKAYVKQLCENIGMKRYGETDVVHFGEGAAEGFSMTQLIETSLISGHFANNENKAFIDVFSCKRYEPDKVAAFTREFFGGNVANVQVHFRK